MTKPNCTIKPLYPASRVDGYIYVLRSGNYYKIGRSIEPDRRIKRLKIQLPFPVELCALIPCEDHKDAEELAHYTFDYNRANGEWFHIEDEAQIKWLQRVVWSPFIDGSSDWILNRLPEGWSGDRDHLVFE